MANESRKDHLKKWKRVIWMLLLNLTLYSMAACSGETPVRDSPNTNETAVKTISEEGIGAETVNSTEALYTYEQISAEEAKRLMDTETDFCIIDARTESEYAEGHIPDAILIPYDEIAERASDLLTNQNQLILVYCRSGRRSKLASQTLASLGYSNVKEFGGIIDWPYEIVK